MLLFIKKERKHDILLILGYCATIQTFPKITRLHRNEASTRVSRQSRHSGLANGVGESDVSRFRMAERRPASR